MTTAFTPTAGATGQITRIILPLSTPPYLRRADRFFALAGHHDQLRDYLGLCGVICQAQQAASQAIQVPLTVAGQARSTHSEAASDCPLDVFQWTAPPVWREILTHLCEQLSVADHLPENARKIVQQVMAQPSDTLDDLAQRFLTGELDESSPTTSMLFIATALQVYFYLQARQLSLPAAEAIPPTQDCPVCGFSASASVLRPDCGGLRYLHCGLCETEWHYVRALCIQCQHAESLTLYTTDPALSMSIECCDDCHTYLKRLDPSKHPEAEILADDVATLGLDMIMGQKGYLRTLGNPFLLFRPD